MKTILFICCLFYPTVHYGQFVFDWDKEDTSHHKLYLHGEGSYQLLAISYSLIAEYTNKNTYDDNWLNYSLGFRAGRTLKAIEHLIGFEMASYIGPYLGIQYGKNRDQLEMTMGIGIFHKRLPSNSNTLPSFTLGYRNQGSKVLFRLGIGYPQITYVSFGTRLF